MNTSPDSSDKTKKNDSVDMRSLALWLRAWKEHKEVMAEYRAWVEETKEERDTERTAQEECTASENAKRTSQEQAGGLENDDEVFVVNQPLVEQLIKNLDLSEDHPFWKRFEDGRPWLDDEAWHPVLAEVRDALHERVISPDPLILGGLLPLVSHVIGFRARFQANPLAVFSLLVAPTNTGKSAIIDVLANEVIPPLINQTALQVRRFDGYFGSLEAIATAYRETKTEKLIQFASEFAVQVKKGKNDGGGPVIQALCDIWFGTAQGSVTKAGIVDLSGKHLSIVAASTPAWLHANLSEVDLAGGFANRFCYWLGLADEPRRIDIVKPIDVNALRRFGTVLMKLDKKLGSPASPIWLQMDPDAETVWIAWKRANEQQAKENENSQIFSSLTARIREHTIRVAGIYALLDEQLVVSRTNMIRATRVGDYLLRSATYAFGDYGQSLKSRAARWVERRLEKVGGRESCRKLQQSCDHDLRPALAESLTQLQREGVIVQEQDLKDRRKRFWVLTLSGDEEGQEG